MRGKKAKLMRKIARMRAKAPDSLRAIERQTYLKTYETRPGPWKPSFDSRIVRKPKARKERNKYVIRLSLIKKLQAFWVPGCTRRIYKDLKRVGV